MCRYPEDVRAFTNNNNEQLSEVSGINLFKFVKGNEDIAIFNYYGEKALEAYCTKIQSIIKRKNFVQFFKNEYYGKAGDILIVSGPFLYDRTTCPVGQKIN